MSSPADLEIIAPGACAAETAAVVAAVQQFLRDTTPAAAPATTGPALNAWKQAALLEGISRQPDQ